ncbi:hypothetical protein [uncultured Halomonas sp.]|uniref:hypothetical protein n=1 Tax=uncultured Halomonas sp. TaxID=173971 RepID=UPI00260463BB|nr:hypothetical protein [uncultured Halomonas sp.]
MAARRESTVEVSFTPVDTLAGLGSANRELLATCLALFDDSHWQQHLRKRYQQVSERWDSVRHQLGQWAEEWRDSSGQQMPPRLSAPEAEEGARELGQRQRYWLESEYGDDVLRLLLWVRLRHAPGLAAQLSTTFRGCGFLADDMTARLIHLLDPPKLVKSGRRWLHQRGWLAKGQQATTMDDVVLPVLDELLEQTLKGEEAPPSAEQRHELLKRAVASLDALDGRSHQRLLEETEANRHNDAALRNALLLGGSLGSFRAGVSAAGFSAYILAAQASAFIPMVSGPGLVSFVAVLSNPITILAVAGGGGWWFLRSAGDKVKAAVAARVVAMLTLQGKLHGPSGLDGARRCFAQAPRLPSGEGICDAELEHYRDEWQRLAVIATHSVALPPGDVLEAMAQPMPAVSPDDGDIDSRVSGEAPLAGERSAAAAMATLTVGDVLYSVAAVDPTVIEAADFARSDEIDSALSFAEMAAQLLSGSERKVLGGVSQLKGYVAEQAVAAQLTAAGHTVSLPEAANQPGWDLLVDGQPFQVKFHASLEGLREHFERYDYPVIANAELSDQVPEEWADSVFFVEGLSNALVEQVTRDSLGAGVELLNPSVVNIAGCISAARGLIAYRRGQLTGKQAVEQVLLDGTVRTGLAAAGSVAGASVGMLLFGPAGALVLGSGSPVLAQMMTTRLTEHLRKRVKGKANCEWESQVHRDLDALQGQVLRSLTHKQAQLEEKIGRLPDHQIGGYLRWRLQDDHAFSKECQMRLGLLEAPARPYPEQRLADTLRVMAMCGVHPAIYQPELREVDARFRQRPGLGEWLSERKRALGAAVTKVRGEHDLRGKVKGVADGWSQRYRRR